MKDKTIALPVAKRRTVLALPALLLAPRAARAQAWPERPVRIVVNYTAGGAADTITRLLQPGMQEALGQPVVVENRPGAGGTIGAAAVARAAADGYTLLFDSAAHVVAHLLFRSLPVDYQTAFSYIGRATVQPYVWMVAERFPARTTQEFIAAARARQQPVTYGTPGIGSSGNIAAEAFAQAAGLRFEHVPYRGGAEAANAMAAGDLDAACITLSSATPVAESGRARLLGVTGAERASSHPQIPTLAEGGVSGFDITSWLGLFGPAGLPPAITEKVAMALQAAASDPATARRLGAAGFEASPSGPADFTAQVARDRQTFGAVVRRAGLQAS
ncbi:MULTISPECIES: Bug family tripartite tricarboxylate transporter substrate binding protein [Roseomonadaceae]|uniref:Twin-arginine translocation pathway signal protein n=1 Tax=Falsiroseomonas oleicola TaxID=2801474 RepID=A0ABS6H8U1_9PROT|nr:tripartite tricarboxylate transporter substrate-binding protein [Roseomonas oleicola]MBU8544791.1 twin-arginine translocation pathway signal protein [Roseomonas oleicola]